MKKEQRLVFLELTSEVDTLLCSFCKYSRGSGCCSPECGHPLVDIAGRFPGNDYGLEPGDDCWGFRNVVNVSDCADAVGIILTNGWDQWVWYLSQDKKRIEVSGRKEAHG